MSNYPDPIHYKGSSMYPTLKNGDAMEIISYDNRKILEGDVIVFQTPDMGVSVVHRIINIDSGTIRTKGDNRRDADSWIVKPQDVQGRVVFVKRGKRRFKIYGGYYGRLTGLWRRSVNKYKIFLNELLHNPYMYLSNSGIFTIFLKWFNPRILTFRSEKGVEIQIMARNYIIGRRLADSNEWLIKKPFRLIFNDRYLKEIELNTKREIT